MAQDHHEYVLPENKSDDIETDTADHHMFRFLRELSQRNRPRTSLLNSTKSNSSYDHDEDLVNSQNHQSDQSSQITPRLNEEANRLNSWGSQHIGRYTVLGRIGQGGMGSVFKAYDDELDRAVAIKLLHTEINKQDSARLKREAQALAKLSHPNVIQVHEVGETENHTFITMELVKGQTLRDWQRQEKRTWKETAAVYLQAGSGLVAAHDEGLVHRDFKPDNAIIDSKGQVRVLDFGLARKITDINDQHAEILLSLPPLTTPTTETVLTPTGAILGTPAYMPPEQWAGKSASAHSDQFSFCASLYEALYGTRPFNGKTVHALMISATNGLISEAQNRHAAPRKLHRTLIRGLSANPKERWPSMRDLLLEIENIATPRNQKWIGLGLTAGLAIVGAGLWLGGDNYAEWMSRCTGANDHLTGIWNDTRRKEVKAAVIGTRLNYAQDVWIRTLEPALDSYTNDWTLQYKDACEATAIRQEQSPEMLDRRILCLHRAKLELKATVDILATADANIVENAHDIIGGMHPLWRCADVDILMADIELPLPEEVNEIDNIRTFLAEAKTQRNAGRYMEARSRLDNARSRLAKVSYEPIRIAERLEEGELLGALGQYQASELAQQEALRLALKSRRWDDARQAAGGLMFTVGTQQERMEEGLRYRELAIELTTKNSVAEAHSRATVANILREQGKYKEAEQECRASLRLYEEHLGPDHQLTAPIRINLANIMTEQGDHKKAEREIRRALLSQTKALGPEHPRIAATRMNLAGPLYKEGRHQEAEAEFRKSLNILENALQFEHTHVASARTGLANTLYAQGKYEEAEREHRRALKLQIKLLGSDHPGVASSRNNLAIVLVELGKFQEAEAQYRQALMLREKALGANHPDVAQSRNNLAIVMMEQKRYEEAEVEYRRALAIMEKLLGPSHPTVAILRNNIVGVLVAQEAFQEAEVEYRQALALLENTLPPEHPMIAGARTNLATVLLELGQFDDALQFAEQAWSRRQQEDIPFKRQATTAFVLARALWASRTERSRALELAKKARDLFVKDGDGSESDRTEVEEWLSSR